VPFRCQDKLYEELVAAAKLSRRTISQEIEARVNQTQELSDRIRELELRADEDRKTIFRQSTAHELATKMLAHALMGPEKPALFRLFQSRAASDQERDKLYEGIHGHLSERISHLVKEVEDAATDGQSKETGK
jgi:hypothetical protein